MNMMMKFHGNGMHRKQLNVNSVVVNYFAERKNCNLFLATKCYLDE